jgi:hypothetical protein
MSLFGSTSSSQIGPDVGLGPTVLVGEGVAVSVGVVVSVGVGERIRVVIVDSEVMLVSVFEVARTRRTSKPIAAFEAIFTRTVKFANDCGKTVSVGGETDALTPESGSTGITSRRNVSVTRELLLSVNS